MGDGGGLAWGPGSLSALPTPPQGRTFVGRFWSVLTVAQNYAFRSTVELCWLEHIINISSVMTKRGDGEIPPLINLHLCYCGIQLWKLGSDTPR